VPRPYPARNHRGRSAKDGDGYGRDPALCHKAEIRSCLAVRPCNRLIADGWIDHDFIDRHTSGFEAFADYAAQFTVDVVITGIRDYRMIDDAGGIQWPLPDTSKHASAGKDDPAQESNTVQAGQLFIPMHYSVANELTFPAFDPYSRQPAYKACAVSVTRL
jgi:anaerobic selenocysteine-containing dehydrogenase